MTDGKIIPPHKKPPFPPVSARTKTKQSQDKTKQRQNARAPTHSSPIQTAHTFEPPSENKRARWEEPIPSPFELSIRIVIWLFAWAIDSPPSPVASHRANLNQRAAAHFDASRYCVASFQAGFQEGFHHRWGGSVWLRQPMALEFSYRRARL